MKNIKYIILLALINFGCHTYPEMTYEEISHNDPNYHDPCQDKQLLKLEKKDSLTDAEMNMYVELRKLCEQRKQAEIQNKGHEKELEIAEDASSGVTTAIVLSVLFSLIAAGIIITHPFH